jgi:hypothetical protein
MGLAVSHLERLALGVGHRPARNGRGLASHGLSSFLDLEGTARRTGTTPDFKPWLFLRGVRFMDCLCACILRHTHARGRIQDRHHCVLDDLILQRSDP